MNNKTNNKKPFYIFTSVDGVLYDFDFASRIHTYFMKDIENPILNKSSIEALDFLLSSLEEYYDTKLFITSHRRADLPSCIDYLKSYGFKYDKPIFATPLKNGTRGKKIIRSMQNDNLHPVQKTKLSTIVINFFNKIDNNQKFKNYVVIDCNPSPRVTKHIPKNHIIKTNFTNASLRMSQVQDFLEKTIYNQPSL